MMVNVFSALIGIGLSYALYAGFNPALDSIIDDVIGVFPTLSSLNETVLRTLPIAVFFIPIVYAVRKAIKGTGLGG